MKNIILILIFGFCAVSFGQNVPYSRLGNPFIQTNIDLIWAAPTNHLPDKLWDYQALPAKVSTTTVSNLMALGSFTKKDRKKIPNNSHIISYADSNGKRGLLINTEWAYIDYSDPDADDFNNTNGVPNRQQAFEMAQHWLPKLGIDGNQLFPNLKGDGSKFFGSPDTVFFYPREGGSAFATNIHMYAVTFFRTLDGIEFSGGCARGGGEIDFGHDAKISHILISWRNYKRDQCYITASPKTLLKWVREGKAVWWPSPNSSEIDWTSIKKITITKAIPLYYSEAYGENDTSQNTAYPFAEMEAIADTGATNLTFYLDCPIMNN